VLKGYTLTADQESPQVWQALGVPKNQIIGMVDDNYWIQEGITGKTTKMLKCGADTELFYDTGKAACSTDCLPNCQCGRFIELSNTLSTMNCNRPPPV